ncbi:MAG: alpha/beta fold hydrolase [Halobacteriota archaeon]
MTRVDNPPNVDNHPKEMCMDDGTLIHVDVKGKDDGKPIVLVHGFALNQGMWKFQVPYLTEKGYRVIAPDLRGFGNSWDPEKQKNGDYTYDTWANDLGTVLEKKKLDRVTLVGYSLGGAIAMHYMSRSPPNVKKLVFISAAGPNMHEDEFLLEDVRLDATRWGFEEFAKIIAKFEKIETKEKKHLRSFVFPALKGLDLIYGKENKYVEWIEGMFEKASPKALIGALNEMRDRNLTEEVKKIRTPTSIYHGVFDPFVPPALGKHLHTLIRGARFTELWGGHGIFYEQIDDINRGLTGGRIPWCTLTCCPVRKFMTKKSDQVHKATAKKSDG